MAVAILANIKGALIFAGGVTISAALIAGSMGSQFTPDTRDGYKAEDDAPAQRERLSKPNRSSVADNPSSPTDQEFFGDFTGFAQDADLIDDTSGFDPSPQEDASVLLEPPPSLDDGDPVESPEARSAPAPRGSPFRAATRAVEPEPGEQDRPVSRKKLKKPEEIAGFKKVDR
ncbi:MAG: hypothetical protein AAFZ11_00535 [Pseudomonadota bacterium]